MYHLSADQIAKDKIIVPNPDAHETAQGARRLISELGSVEKINNFYKAHYACGKFIETLDAEKDLNRISDTLGVMLVIENLIASAIIGGDQITIVDMR